MVFFPLFFLCVVKSKVLVLSCLVLSYATISHVLNEMICLDGREKARRTYSQIKLIKVEQFRNSYCCNTELMHRTHILLTSNGPSWGLRICFSWFFYTVYSVSTIMTGYKSYMIASILHKFREFNVSMARFEDIYVFHIYILSCFANAVLCFDTELFLNTEWCVMFCISSLKNMGKWQQTCTNDSSDNKARNRNTKLKRQTETSQNRKRTHKTQNIENRNTKCQIWGLEARLLGGSNKLLLVNNMVSLVN